MGIVGYIILAVFCLSLVFAVGSAFLYLMHKDLPEDEREESLYSGLVSTLKGFSLFKCCMSLIIFLFVFSFSFKPLKEVWLYLFITIVVLGALALIYIMLGGVTFMLAFMDERDEEDFFDEGYVGFWQKIVWVLTWPKQLRDYQKTLTRLKQGERS